MCFYDHSAIERATCELHVDWPILFVFIFFGGGGETFELSALEFSEEPDTVVKKIELCTKHLV